MVVNTVHEYSLRAILYAELMQSVYMLNQCTIGFETRWLVPSLRFPYLPRS